MLGIHILKEMFNLTDQEALEQLEFNPSAALRTGLLWRHALRLTGEEAHLPQKPVLSLPKGPCTTSGSGS